MAVTIKKKRKAEKAKKALERLSAAYFLAMKGVDYPAGIGLGSAITVDPVYVAGTKPRKHGLTYSTENSSGWKISGMLKNDHYWWVNEFSAEHPVHGKVWGNFESQVLASDKKAFEEFIASHPPVVWNYGDI